MRQRWQSLPRECPRRWLLTAGALAVLGAVWPGAPTAVQTVTVGVGTIAATVVKFVVMRRWRGVDEAETEPPARTGASEPADASTIPASCGAPTGR